jgi:GntR family galactonate operon transcriptional repressor
MIKPRKMGQTVSALGRGIARGEFAPGTSLPAERHLEIRFGASRSVVREAVKILASKGLVTVGARVGTRVRPRSDWSLLDQDVLGWMSSDGLAQEMLLALGEARQIIEPAAAALAAERATAEDRAHIRQAYQDMAAHHEDHASAMGADKRFHLAILSATHNPVLGSFRPAIEVMLDAVFEVTIPMLVPNLANHEAVASSIEKGDGDAARASMDRLLARTHHIIAGVKRDQKQR